MSGLRIGEFAALSGVSTDTIRYYEKVKLLPRAGRTSAGYRLYNNDDVERVHFIKQAQTLGLSLDEIRILLIAEGGDRECLQVRDLLQKKLIQLDEKLRLLRSFRHTLSNHLTVCEQQLREAGDRAECPVIVDLTHQQHSSKKRIRTRT